MPILQLKPCYKDYIWGGNALKKSYPREDRPQGIVAESWEAACHKNGSSIITGGEFDGLTLDRAAALSGDRFYGSSVPNRKLPILFKLIDAKQRLSVQVHPNDEYAARDNERGKTEMWIVLQAEPDACIFAGFEHPISADEFREHIQQQTLEKILRRIPVSAGDAVIIPAGLVHAIGEGLVIAELQQNSDATYRVYDWGRVDANGHPRELHIQKAIDVTDFSLGGELAAVRSVSNGSLHLDIWPETAYFSAARGFGSGIIRIEGNFRVLFAAEGTLTVNGSVYPAGSTLLVTADTEEFTVSSAGSFLMFK